METRYIHPEEVGQIREKNYFGRITITYEPTGAHRTFRLPMIEDIKATTITESYSFPYPLIPELKFRDVKGPGKVMRLDFHDAAALVEFELTFDGKVLTPDHHPSHRANALSAYLPEDYWAEVDRSVIAAQAEARGDA